MTPPPPPTGPRSDAEQVLDAAVMVAALAQNGLTYSTEPFDLDRFAKLRDIAAELLGLLSGRTVAELRVELGRESGYATPKVEVRGALVDAEGRLLLMRETVDGRWSLPGGFADPLDTPSQAVVREIREETGYQAEVVKLVGCWDRDFQGHLPRLPFSIYKLFFLCREVGPRVAPAELETLDVGWFGLDELPELSTGRVSRAELERMLAHHADPSLPTEFD